MTARSVATSRPIKLHEAFDEDRCTLAALEIQAQACIMLVSAGPASCQMMSPVNGSAALQIDLSVVLKGGGEGCAFPQLPKLGAHLRAGEVMGVQGQANASLLTPHLKAAPISDARHRPSASCLVS